MQHFITIFFNTNPIAITDCQFICTCPDCGHLEIRYRSCGNRNCPQCGGWTFWKTAFRLIRSGWAGSLHIRSMPCVCFRKFPRFRKSGKPRRKGSTPPPVIFFRPFRNGSAGDGVPRFLRTGGSAGHAEFPTTIVRKGKRSLWRNCRSGMPNRRGSRRRRTRSVMRWRRDGSFFSAKIRI